MPRIDLHPKTSLIDSSQGFKPFFLLSLILFAFFAISSIDAQPTLVTQRFGEQSTCDVKNISTDARVRATQPAFNGGDEAVLYYRWVDSRILMHFDLSSIPAGAKVHQARLRLFYSYDFYDGGQQGVSKTIYKIDDPEATGLWDEYQVTYAKKRSDQDWSAGGGLLDTVQGEAIGSLYFLNWEGFTQDFIDADITGGVQGWVNDPASNNGFFFACNEHFNMRLSSRDYEDETLRPYLEITYEGSQDEVIPQASAIGSVYHSGQTFVTWTEAQTGIDETSYRIYRSDAPITTANLAQAERIDQVYQGSSYLTDNLVIKQPELGPIGIALSEDTGLYVYTVENDQDSYWAVTTVVQGNENRTITPGTNATNAAVAETVDLPTAFYFSPNQYGLYDGYVMWLGRFNPADPSDSYGFDNRRSAPVFFSVVEPHQFDENKVYPLTLYLHAYSHDYFGSTEGVDNSRYIDESHWGGYSLGFNDFPHLIVRNAAGELLDIGPYIETDNYGYTYYSGWNSNYIPASVDKGFPKTFERQRPFEEGRSVLYSEKSMMFITDWMLERSPWASYMDEDRVYATGSSMGASGSLFLGIHYPDRFAAINIFHGRTTIFYEAEGAYSHYAERQFGSVAMNIPTPEGIGIYDYMNIGKCLQREPTLPYPLIRSRHGRNDETIPWSQVPGFYRMANQAHLGLQAFFDQSAHNGADPDSNFTEYIDIRQFVANQDKPQFNLFHFRRTQSYPAFSDGSLDDAYGDGTAETGVPRGGINRFPCWQIDSVVDTPSEWSVEIFLLNESPADQATVTVTPRRLQALPVKPGDHFGWRNVRLSDGAILQSGSVVADALGLVSIPEVLIAIQASRLEITPQDSGLPLAVEGAPTAIDYADTLSAPAGAWVSLWGIGFGSTQGSSQVEIGGISASEIHQWTDTRIDLRVPEEAASGLLSVVINGRVTDGPVFVVRDGSISYVEPESAVANDANDGSVDAPWKTLAKAVASVGPGDTVYLGTGVYRESLVPTVSGSEGLPIMFKAIPGQFPLLDGSGLDGTPDGIRLDGTLASQIGYYIFSGLTLTNFDESVYMVSGAHDCHFYDLDVGYGRGGLYFYGASGSFVAQSRFHHQSQFGVIFYNYSSDIYVRDCVADNNGQTVGSGYESDSTVENVTLFRCRAHHNAGAGFDMKVDGLLLNECAAFDNQTGIRIEGSSRVQNTWVYNNTDRGIFCAPQGGQTPVQAIINCTVAGSHALAGIEVGTGADIQILNTISVGSQGPALLLQDNYVKPVLSYCIVQTEGPDMPAIVWGANTASASLWTAEKINQGLFAAGTDQPETLLAGIVPDRLFKDYAAGDLMLAAISPARNFGDSENAPDYDYYRFLRNAADGHYDIGAIEYHSTGFSAVSKGWTLYW